MVLLTGKDGCHESVEDNADVQKAWIEKMMKKGLCNCDEEHMFDCPSGTTRTDEDDDSGADQRQTAERNDALDDVLNRILNEQQVLVYRVAADCYRQ